MSSKSNIWNFDDLGEEEEDLESSTLKNEESAASILLGKNVSKATMKLKRPLVRSRDDDDVRFSFRYRIIIS